MLDPLSMVESGGTNRSKLKQSMPWPQKLMYTSRLLYYRLLATQLRGRRMIQTLFVTWLVVVIYLILKLSDTNNLSGQNKLEALPWFQSNHDERKDVNGQDSLDHYDDSIIIPQVDGSSDRSNSSYHINSGIKNYIRKSKVFILLIENENSGYGNFDGPIETSPNQRRTRRRTRRLVPEVESDIPNPNRIINLSRELRLIIDILESHRIKYTIGSTRNGIPTSLLIDSLDQNLNVPEYSVIIIDDFIKYTRLSRWLRDQLDRHCRKNKIGVITYVKAGSIEKRLQTNPLSYNDINGGLSSRTPSKELSARESNQVSSSQGELLADEFPLSFKVIHQNSCNPTTSPNITDSNLKQQGPSKKASSCLFDYQLNDRSAILRILRRRPNFILPGPLIRNMNSWVSISSNHITYEPLTWATLLRKPIDKLAPSVSSISRMSNMTLNGNTRSLNYDSSNMSKLDNVPLLEANRARLVRAAAASASASTSLSIETNHSPLTSAHVSIRREPSTSLISSSSSSSSSSRKIILPDMSNVSNSSDSQFSRDNSDESFPIDHKSINNLIKADADYNEHIDKIMSKEAQDDYDMARAIDGQNNVRDNNEIDDDSHDHVYGETVYGLNENESYRDTKQQDSSLINDSIDRQVLAMYDRGLYDGIKRVIFGGTHQHWLNRILLLDSIEHLSDGRILTPLERYIQIDIDDIFVGERGTKLGLDDVDALVESQAELEKFVPNFKYNLGYSGKFFEQGLELEKAGDRRLVESSGNFSWFCHTWSHSKAHLANSTAAIELELRENLKFAFKHKLPILGSNVNGKLKKLYKEEEEGKNNDKLSNEAQYLGDKRERLYMAANYAVAPHHSGVYPIHEQLYEAWNRVLNVQVTSTEEYPHLRPANGRRGFVHKSIKVLPRQTCGLYTHTIYKRNYPGGFRRLLASIEGGDLFNTILHEQVNIYMSHQSNYGHDRLAPLTFKRLFEFVQLHTNLQLRSRPPELGQQHSSAFNDADADAHEDEDAAHADTQAKHEAVPKANALQLADLYFSLYPDEYQEPVWTNPCSDPRHLAIWAKGKHCLCKFTPNLLILGPQKTGTTALLDFLKLSPRIKSSTFSPKTDYEEVQFFNEKHYWRGVDWYLNRFHDNQTNKNGSDTTSSDTSQLQSEMDIIVDKSATYFDDPKVPQRAHALLPDAKLIIILIDPADRAYSWYQHQRAHNDPIALAYSFEQIINSDQDDLNNHNNTRLQLLRNRCITPGFYSAHLSRWLDFYHSRQVIIIDGQWFRLNPAAVLNRLQRVLLRDFDTNHLDQIELLNYHELLVYDKHKRFYCKRNKFKKSSTSCLGPSKGRRYIPMSQDSRLYLNRLYYGHNKQLARLLTDLGQPLPAWLVEATSINIL